MNTAKKKTSGHFPINEAELLSLELRVAKHADRLWRSEGCCGGKDLVLWLRAESEVLGQFFGLEWPALALLGVGS